MENFELQTATQEHGSQGREKAVVAPEHVNDQRTAPFDLFFGGAPGESQDGRPTRLMKSASLAHSVNGAVRAIAFNRAQQTDGNRFVQRAIAGRSIQRQCSCGGTCDKCKQDEERRTIQRKAEGEGAPKFQAVTNTQGKPLTTESQSRLEIHFGADLSDVRVHTNSEASASAASLDAMAYTSGRDIYFARGMYAPSTSSGDRLLAHEVAHVVQQSSGKEPSIAMKPAGGVKIGAPDDGLEIQADQSAEEYMRGGGSARGEEHQKLPAPQSPAPIQRAPEPAPQASQPAADPGVVQNAVDAVCKGIDDDNVDAVVAPMRGLSISAAASLRSGVLMRKTVLLERWLLKPHGDQKTLEDIASIALITAPSVVVRTKITATAEEGLRLLWPALPLIDRLEVYDEGFREIEQAQLDVIRQASLKERADAQKQAAPRLFAVYSKMSAKEEFEARNLMDSSEVAKGDTAVRMIQRGDKDVVYDALMALDRVDRKFVFDQHYMELKDLLDGDEFKLVATLTHASEAQTIIARLRLATEDRKDDMEAVRAMVERAVALLAERQQLREARSARLLTAADRAGIDERLQELDDLDVLLQFKRTAKGNLKENTFMALLAGAEDQQAAFGSHMDRLAQFSSNRRAFALEAAKQRVLIAGSNQDELRSILLTTHAPVDPEDKTKRSDLKQWEEDVEFRKELLSDPQVHKVFVGLRESEQMHVLTALQGDAFDDKLERLNQMKNAALWGEFFDLIRTVARNDEWRTRFEKTKTEYWSLYAFVSGEEREIMEKILHDPEHRIPIIELLRYTGKVSTLKAAFANLQENEREQLRTGWAMANHPFIGPRTEPQDSALAAFRQFEEELKKSQGSDKDGYETILATVLGTAPTKSEMSTGQGRYNAAAILAERVEKSLGLGRGIAADFTETDETMDAAGRQFAALWLRLKDQPELSIVEYATLSTLYQQFEHRAEEFSEAAKAITDMAGTIAATLAGIVVIVATGGAATPAVVAMAATAGAAGGFVAREAFGGDYYTAMSSEGERALLLDSINGALSVLSGSLAARGVELMGLSGRALAQGMVRVGEGAVQEAAQSLGRKVLVSGAEATLDGLISGMVSESAATFTDDRTWREGIMEGLARVGKSALLGGLFGLAGGAALGSAMPLVGRAAGGLWKAVSAGNLEKSLIRAGMGDILKSAQAAARSGDAHAVDMLITQMEGHLAAEDAALLRQQLREELTEVLGHPPGTASPSAEDRALLEASSAVEDGAKLTAEQKAAETNIVARSEPQISHEPGYVDEVDLGNGHVWRRTEEGTWCRFTTRSLCGTKIAGARPPRVRVGTSPPYEYRILNVDYSTLPRDTLGNIAPLPEGVVYEFPGGHRVWREGEAIRHDSVLGPRIGRRGTEKEIFSAGETGLPELAGMERAHTLGQGTGFESPFGIFLAPREVNQIIQNNGVEELLRGLRDSARPGEAFRVSTLTVPHPGSLRLKEVRYRVELVRNGKQDFMFEYVINIGDVPNPTVTHEVASITQSPDVAAYFDLVDVPERLRTRFARFRRR